ncbi:nucleotidyltransferase [Capnocytophaga canimorsus]|uniref:nucleotidyltransferase n=1 Tax=Capnocytophaga canimorsus TaxID=28188 RepID=UPI0037D1FB6A
MARSIQDIQEQIYQAKASEPALNELNSTSKTAIWRLMIYIVSVAIWTLEKLFDLHTADIDDKLARLKPGTARWYHSKTLAFQYGFDLLPDSDKFDNTGNSEEAIGNSRIIKYAAVVDTAEESRIVIKIATEQNGELSPVTAHQQEAFSKYINEIKYAGVYVTILNNQPDILKLNIRVVRNPLILDENGLDVNTAKYPVKEAIQSFMKRLPFNGELSLQTLTDEIQKVPGVVDLSIDLAQSKWIDGSIYGAFSPINISRIPESGYFKVNFDEQDETQSKITYL